MPRVSLLPSFAICPGFATLRGCGPRDVSGTAAQNGSAVGRAVELWHRLGEDEAAYMDALAQIRHEAADDFPAYEEDAVVKWLRPYAADPRNQRTAHLVAQRTRVYAGVVAEWQERELTCTIDPAEDDPTQQPIVMVGHVDQVRRTEHGTLRVWDVKSSQAGGAQLVCEHAWQLAAYALGATQSWGEGDVMPGGIIRLRGYCTRAKYAEGHQPVFFEAPWTLDECREILSNLASHVSLLRQGVIQCNPGRYCSFCPGVSPAQCAQHLAQIPDAEFLKFACIEKEKGDE